MTQTMSSLFTWIADWWRTGGGASVSGTRVSWPAAGGRTAVNESAAAPIGDGRFDVVLRYQAPTRIPLSVAYTRYRDPGGAGRIGDTATTQVTLPAAPAMTTTTLELPTIPTDSDASSFRPILTIGATGLVIEDLAIVPRPISNLVRSWAAAEAVNTTGRDSRLRAWARPGDTAVIIMASQWGNTPCRPPTGWQVSYAAQIPSGRSGYVATHTVTGAAWQHLEIDPWGGKSSGARDRALLIILRGATTHQVIGWQDTIPALPQDRSWILASQLHAVAATHDTAWTMPGAGPRMQAGQRTPTASWSTLHALAGAGAPVVPQGATRPQGWAAVVAQPRVSGPRASVWTGEAEVPARVGRMPRGAASVDALLAKRGFVVAHRGGSASWPESSMQAYTQAVAHGADALEVSCHRTSDGVWIVAHDQTLQRVDPSAPATPITQMTWEQVRRFRTKGQPIVRLEQILEAYGRSHVLVVDPKGSALQHQDFLSRFRPETTVFKFSADATWLLSAAQRAGFRTWGYGYAEHALDGRLATWASACDYLGMEYGASAEAWKRTLEIGKPVWAHICPTRQAYETGLAAGAVGCMVSGISSVLPKGV